ncbi:hypothetical protein M422DRAFT_30873, partial [Sphaerobolus stellatus SS14]
MTPEIHLNINKLNEMETLSNFSNEVEAQTAEHVVYCTLFARLFLYSRTEAFIYVQITSSEANYGTVPPVPIIASTVLCTDVDPALRWT